MKLVIRTCPTCGSKRIRRVKRDIESSRGGKAFLAHGIEVSECPDCGERLFSIEAIDEINAKRQRAQRGERPRTLRVSSKMAE
jgi:YgiT-type zinc finger domain-containing protein